MKFELTQEDIDKNGHSCGNCPYHRAIMRSVTQVFPEAWVIVGSYSFRVNFDYQKSIAGITTVFPLDISSAIRRYDDDVDKLTPHKFEIPIL